MKLTLLTSFFSFVSCLIINTSAFSQDLDLFAKETYISTSGEVLPFRILKPLNFDAKKKYPVVLFLHGAGERGDNNEAQLTHGASTFLLEKYRTEYPCFVIAPQCPKEGYWASASITRDKYPLEIKFDYAKDITPALDAAIELLASYRAEKFIDTSRVYITGLSMGGMGTFEAVGRFPKLFAAAAPVCGGGDTEFYNASAAKVPFWIFHGDKDNVVSVEHSRNMYARLIALKADVKYTEYAEVNHNSWENAYNEADLIPWMFSKKIR